MEAVGVPRAFVEKRFRSEPRRDRNGSSWTVMESSPSRLASRRISRATIGPTSSTSRRSSSEAAATPSMVPKCSARRWAAT